MRPEYWLHIARHIREVYHDYDGFVITHGTDTMAYAAAMLYYLIQNSPKPIVLTGAQIPIHHRDTDARNNLYDAFLYATDDGASGVHVVFDDKVIAGTRAKKIRTKSYNAFESMDFPVLANVRDGRIIQYIHTPKADKPEFYLELDERVGVLTLTPGLRAEVLDMYFRYHTAVVLSGYGTGGIPEGDYYGFYDVIQSWEGKGKTLVVTTQVQHEGSDMNVYQVGRGWKNRFDLMEGYNLTYEAITTKLMWILGYTKDDEQIKKLFYKTINYDLIG
jgi:L-asparaginase